MLTTDCHSTICHYHESYLSILPPHHPISLKSILIIFINLCLFLLSGLIPLDFTKKSCMQFSSLPYMPQTQGYNICWSKKEDFAVTFNFFKKNQYPQYVYDLLLYSIVCPSIFFS